MRARGPRSQCVSWRPRRVPAPQQCARNEVVSPLVIAETRYAKSDAEGGVGVGGGERGSGGGRKGKGQREGGEGASRACCLSRDGGRGCIISLCALRSFPLQQGAATCRDCRSQSERNVT